MADVERGTALRHTVQLCWDEVKQRRKKTK